MTGILDDPNTKPLLVPQLGEGLRHVRLIALLKKPGDRVEQDEPIYEIETEKANVAVESPHAGVLLDWLAEPGDEVLIHGPIGHIAIGETVPGTPEKNGHAPTPVRIPPRTRAFARQRGVAESVLATIPALSGTLTEDDIIRFLDGTPESSGTASDGAVDAALPAFEEFPLSSRQQALNRNALRGAVSQPLPAMVRRLMSWDSVIAAKNKQEELYPGTHFSEFQILAYCAVRSASAQPKFFSTLIGGTVVRRYRHLSLGFAVPLPDDELTTAVVHRAETLDLPAFARAIRSQMRRARAGEIQVDETTTLLLSSLSGYGIVDASPVIVPPAIAVLFLGAPFESGSTAVNMTLTFDHRLINGVGAAQFLAGIDAALQTLL